MTTFLEERNYRLEEARRFVTWLPGTGPAEELVTAFRVRGTPKVLRMHPDVLHGLSFLELVDQVWEPSLSKYLPDKFSHYIVMGIKVKLDKTEPCPASMGLVVMRSL